MEKIRVGVIGCSGMAQAHMRGVLACDYATLVAICDINRVLAEKTGKDFSGVQVYFDAEEMLASAEMDAVIIVTPDRTHRALCEEVMAYATQSRTDLPYDDTTVAILRFTGGVIGKVFVSISCKRDYTMRSVFYGTKGTILTDNTSPAMTLFYEDDAQGGKLCREEIPIDIKNHNAQGEFAEFARIIRDDLPVSTSALEGTKTVETAIAIVTSSERGGEKVYL